MEIKSNYTGSKVTKNMVASQIAERWGKSEVDNYNPFSNALSYKKWAEAGYSVKKGEKALKSIVYFEKKDKDGNVVMKYPRKINLFYYLQVEKAS